MKRIIRLLACISAVAASLSCGNEAAKAVDVVGEWELYSIDGTPADGLEEGFKTTVYLSFTAEGNFEIFQKLGEGRFRKYEGTFSVTEDLLSGTYSDGESWGATYKAENGGSTLTLTAQNGSNEVSIYNACTIPADVRSEATSGTKAEDDAEPRFL